MRLHAIAVVVIAICMTTECQRADKVATKSEAETPSPARQWVGKWIGPEGTFLVIQEGGFDFTVIINSLDGPNSYSGKAVANGIAFQRNGRDELVHAGSGADTGMKWLLDKKHCLVINKGEGFCRD